MKRNSSISSEDNRVLQRSIFFAMGFALLLWLVRAIEWGIPIDLGVFGIFPRSLPGMIGIITGPLVHGTFLHLLSNTFPLIFLLVATFYFYDKIALEVFLWIYLITGFWVWVAARQAYHIGSSGIVYGLAAFLLFSGLFRKDVRSIAVAVVIAFLYNGMLQGLLPNPGQQNVSWESHLLGAAAGIFCAFYFRTSDGLSALIPGTAELNETGHLPKVSHTFSTENYFTSSRSTFTRYSYSYSSDKYVNRENRYTQVISVRENDSDATASEI
ncbi:MAG: rhomboid family intramembrane serine protease [Bacteroidota bacterium]